MKPYVSLVVFLGFFFFNIQHFLCSSLSQDIEIDTSFMAKMHSPNGKLWSQTIWCRIKFRDIILFLFSTYDAQRSLYKGVSNGVYWSQYFLALSLHASVLKPYGLQLNRLIRAGVHCLKRHFFEANHHALKGILLKLTQST